MRAIIWVFVGSAMLAAQPHANIMFSLVAGDHHVMDEQAGQGMRFTFAHGASAPESAPPANSTQGETAPHDHDATGHDDHVVTLFVSDVSPTTNLLAAPAVDFKFVTLPFALAPVIGAREAVVPRGPRLADHPPAVHDWHYISRSIVILI